MLRAPRTTQKRKLNSGARTRTRLAKFSNRRSRTKRIGSRKRPKRSERVRAILQRLAIAVCQATETSVHLRKEMASSRRCLAKNRRLVLRHCTSSAWFIASESCHWCRLARNAEVGFAAAFASPARAKHALISAGRHAVVARLPAIALLVTAVQRRALPRRRCSLRRAVFRLSARTRQFAANRTRDTMTVYDSVAFTAAAAAMMRGWPVADAFGRRAANNDNGGAALGARQRSATALHCTLVDSHFTFLCSTRTWRRASCRQWAQSRRSDWGPARWCVANFTLAPSEFATAGMLLKSPSLQLL